MAPVFLAATAFVAAAFAAVVALPLRKRSLRMYAAVVAVFPVLALALYQILGTPAALDPAARAPVAVATEEAGHADPAAFAAAVAQLRAELESNPAQPDGWPLLARSLAMQGDFAGARDAFAKALELVPDDPGLLVDAAQAGAQAHPQNLFDEAAIAQLQRAIALQPENQRARWFIGVSQRQRGLPAEAAATWEALLPEVEPSTAASLRTQIDEARIAAGLPPLPVVVAPAATAQVATAGGSGLRVKVSLDPAFAARARLRDDAVVFVSARVPGGPRMPVAAERHAIQDLPLDIVLDDSDSPMPTQKLSALDEVEVSARLSASGDASRSGEDIESAPVRVTLSSDAVVELVIGRPAP